MTWSTSSARTSLCRQQSTAWRQVGSVLAASGSGGEPCPHLGNPCSLWQCIRAVEATQLHHVSFVLIGLKVTASHNETSDCLSVCFHYGNIVVQAAFIQTPSAWSTLLVALCWEALQLPARLQPLSLGTLPSWRGPALFQPRRMRPAPTQMQADPLSVVKHKCKVRAVILSVNPAWVFLILSVSRGKARVMSRLILVIVVTRSAP